MDMQLENMITMYTNITQEYDRIKQTPTETFIYSAITFIISCVIISCLFMCPFEITKYFIPAVVMFFTFFLYLIQRDE
jgi:ABC-type enterochelin transport system permease subunit